MARIGRIWAGRIFGTNTGNASAVFDSDEDHVTGTIRFNDDSLGPIAYDVEGEFDGANLKLSGEAKDPPQGVEFGTVAIDGHLHPDGTLRGEWQSTLGTGGNFVFHPHDSQVPAGGSKLPEQLYSANRTIGAVRLYAADLPQLVEALMRDMPGSRVIVTCRHGLDEASYYWSDFQARAEAERTFRYLKLSIQAPDADGLSRQVIVELDAFGANTVRAQGVQESWVIGKAESLVRFLSRNQVSTITGYRRFGSIPGLLIALIVIAMLPDMTFPSRLVFIAAGVIAWLAFAYVHSRLIPNALISVQEKQPGMLSKIALPILSWLGGIVAATLTAVLGKVLEDGLPNLAAKLGAIL